MIKNSKFINSKDTYTLHSQEIYRSPKEVNYAGITDLNSEASYKLDNKSMC